MFKNTAAAQPIEDDMAKYAPLTARFFDDVCKEFPILSGKIHSYRKHLPQLSDQYFTDAEHIMQIVEGICADRGADRTFLMNCFAEFVIDYLREQEYFLRTGNYRNQERDFQEIKEEVYLNDQYMLEYMMGLLASYAVFPHHYEQYRFYVRNFLPMLDEGGGCVEFGSGHGLFLSETLQDGPERKVVGYDISPVAVDLTKSLFRVAGTDIEKAEVLLGDILEEDFPAEKYDGMTAAGLLEHIPDPVGFLGKMRNKLTPETGRVFVMLPVNTAHPDHMILFNHEDECRDLMTGAGFEMVEELIVPTEDMPEIELREKRIPIMYLGIFKTN